MTSKPRYFDHPEWTALLDALEIGILHADRSCRLVYANRRAREIEPPLRNCPPGEPLAKAAPRIAEPITLCLQSGEPVLSHKLMDHGRTRAIAHARPLRFGGRLRGVVCCLEDVALVEESAASLDSFTQLRERSYTIFNCSSDGIWVSDGSGTIVDVNPAAERLCGVKAAEVIGKKVTTLVDQGLADRVVTTEVLESKRPVVTMQYFARTGKHLLVTGIPVFDDHGNISLVITYDRDITRLNSLKEQWEQNRLVAERYKDELVELSLLELERQEIVAESEEMRQVIRVSLKMARLGVSNILILGESGVGKGLLAKFIHKNSDRANKPFIQINCAALPESLLEAELFGYEKGAFTGARQEGKAGLFELAQEGTLFLDEIGDLPFAVQAKLLKYLDDHEVMRLGSVKSKKVDCCIIAATNQNLEELVRQGRFRRDLFFRLNTFTVRIPPLRERPEDIFELTRHFLDAYNRQYKMKKKLSPSAVAALQSHGFPGNVRELQNLLKKALVMSEQDLLDDYIISSVEDSAAPPARARRQVSKERTLPQELLALERQRLQEARRRCRSTREMAAYLGISQPSVIRKLKKHGLPSP